MLKIEKNEIHLWFTCDLGIQDEKLLTAYQALLNEDERQCHLRFLFQRRRHQYLVTRALVRDVLSQYEASLTAQTLLFTQNKYGKPAVSNFSEHSDLNFNISHTQGLVVLAVTRINELGVDVETLSRQADIIKLAKRYFSAQENNELNALEMADLNERFFDLWTLKESYIKACGMGLLIPLKDFSFQFSDELIQVSFSPQRNDDPGRWRFWQLQVHEKYKLALAVTGDDLNAYQLICRRGVPLQAFEEISQEIARQSAIQ